MAQLAVDVEMLTLFKAELELCKLGPGQTLAVLSAGNEKPEYAQAFMLAAQELGATAFQVNVPRAQTRAAGVQGRHPLTGNQPAIDSLKQADLLIDLMGLLFSKEQAEIQATGTRVLRVIESFNVLKQMFPTEDLRRRVEYSKKLLETCKEIHITSDAGTNVRYSMGQYPVISEYGYTDEPGRWDHFPSGFSFTQANDGGIEGTVVLQAGDIFAAFKRYVQSPITLRIEKGYITDISGEGMDAQLMRKYIESFHDPRGFAVSHIGWGLNERANWHRFATTQDLQGEYVMNALSFYGNVLFSTGPNTELGGKNDTPCHMDLPMHGCNLVLDGVQILEKGEVVHPQMRAPGR